MVVLFLTLPLSFCVPFTCPSYAKKLIKDNCAGCGVCQTDKKSSKTLCFYDQLGNYFSEGDKCNLELYCNIKDNSDRCKGLKCLSMLGAFRCQCDSNTYGTFCEYSRVKDSAHNDYALVDDVIFTPLVFYGEFSTVTFIFSNVGINLRVEVETSLERFSYNSGICEKVIKETFCKKWFNDYPSLCKHNSNIKTDIICALTVQFLFPSDLESEKGKYIYSTHDASYSYIIGNKHNISVSIYNKIQDKFSSPVFTSNYTVANLIEGPKIYKCEPELAVRNAGESMNDAIVFTLNDEIVITSSYKLKVSPECRGAGNAKLSWTVWKIYTNHNDLTSKPFKEIFKDRKLNFPAFSLGGGVYKIKVKVSVWKHSEESFSYRYAYFKVDELDLLPVISGGEERTEYYNVKFLKLDGSLSRDPNMDSSKQKNSLKFYWKCDKLFDFCKQKRSDYKITYPGPFETNVTYTFYLTVISTRNNELQATTSQQIHILPTQHTSVQVMCKKNCGGKDYESNPGYIIYLKAVVIGVSTTAQDNYKFDWVYNTGKDKNLNKSVDAIRQSNTPDNVLIIRKNSLAEGEIYLFHVKGKGNDLGEAKFRVKMSSKLSGFSCNPSISFKLNNIVRGVTRFKVVCDKLKYNKVPPIYDFYDRNLNNKDDNGRLIVSGKSNIAFDVVLTRGKLVVEVTNEYGMTGVTELITKLQNSTNVTDIVERELNNLKQNGSTSGAVFRSNTISVILDLVATESYDTTKFSSIVDYMLKVASEDEISSIATMKIWTGLVDTIANEGVYENFSTKSINYISKFVGKLSRKLLYEIRERLDNTEMNDLTDEEVYRLSHSMLKTCNAICDSSNKDIVKRRLRDEDSYSLHASHRESSDSLVRAVDRIMLSVALTALPHESPKTMKENSISIWIKEDTPESFSTINNESVTSVTISEILARSISHKFNTISVQVAEFEDNPYWYNSEIDIHTHAVNLQVRVRKEDSIPFIDEILHPVIINLQHLETETKVINGSVCQPYSNESLDLADLAVAVHQLRILYKGSMNLKFLNLKENLVIRVRVLFNFRPDYELMTEPDVAQVTKLSPNLKINLKSDAHSHDIYDLYYVGILPGVDVPDGTCLNYSFEISAVHCVTWMFHEWSTGGCRVKGVLNSKQLQCECEHLSTFAGFSRVPINTVDPFSDYKLLLGVWENPFVFIFVVFLMSVYFILLIWALRKDCKQEVKGGAVYLEDNFPGDPFPYLVAVYTGNKLFSGTTSNVGIVIEGEDAGSRPHILKSSSHHTLETGDDNWFILFTPYHLGDLIMIHLWIDYSGKSPEWFCHKVMVVDLLTYKEYLFLVDTWMSLTGDEYIERFVEVSKPYDEHPISTAIDNLILGFRETHLWVSVLTRHPRSSVTRAQRLSLAFTGLLVTMLVSCMFYGVVEERKEDYSSFSLSIREFVVAVLSLVISSALINIVVSLFRRRLVWTLYDEGYMLEEDEEDGNEVKQSKAKVKAKSKARNPFKRFVKDVLKIVIKPKKFKPVLLNIEEINIIYKKKNICDNCWIVLTWSVCISMICLCSYFIVLYGLKFGKVKSLEWLTSVALSLLQIIFLVAPFRIISLATVSGVLSSKMYEDVSYRIQPQLLEKCKVWQLNSNPNLEKKLMHIRSQQCYTPLSYNEFTEKLYKQKKKVGLWLLLDMVLIFVLVVLMFLQNETLWTTKYYWNNQQLTSLLRQGYEEEGIQLYSLTNLSLFSLFLEKNVFPVIYQSKWYNGLPIVDRNVTDDFRFVFSGTSKLFGLPRLRQIRLKPDLCEKPIYENLSQHCNVKLTEDTEDTNLYAEGWVETGPQEKFLELSPWSYMETSETFDTTFYGYSNIAYKGDGYVAELDKAQEKAEDIVLMLHREKWLDRRTCVVIFELTLYNAFSGTFSWLISVTENLHIGLLTNRVFVFTVGDSYNYPFVDIVCFSGLLMFAVRVFFVVNRNGVDKLFYNFWNLFELMIVGLAVACAVLFMLNIYSRFDYLKPFLFGIDDENYFQYFHLLQYLEEFRIVLLILVMFLVCRFTMSFRFGKSFSVFFDSVVFDWNKTFWIFIIIASFFFTHWRIFSYILNNYTLTKSNFILISRVDFKQIVKNCSNVQCKIGIFVLCSVSYFVQLLIMSYLVVSYRITKRKFSEKEQLNFFTIFCAKREFSKSVAEGPKRKSKVLISV